VVRGVVIGVTAVAVPSVALGITTVFIVGGLKPFLGLLGVTVVLVGGLAWVCVHIGHFPPRLAVFLTTFPFGVLVLLTLSALAKGNGGGFVLCLGQLALAVCVAWAATRLAMRRTRNQHG
jgi:hypothetical protein